MAVTVAGPTHPSEDAGAVEAKLPLEVGQCVCIFDQRGIVRFIGQTKFADGSWIGVELDEPTGTGDGTVRGVRYFECKPQHGMFLQGPQLAQVPSELARFQAKVRQGVEEERQRKLAAHPEGGPAESKGAFGWSFAGWLRSQALLEDLSKKLVGLLQAEQDPDFMLAFVKELPSWPRPKAVLHEMLTRCQALDVLAGSVLDGGRELSEASAASGAELHNKFLLDGNAFRLSYGKLNIFFGGLEALIGSPDADLLSAMIREHCESPDSETPFETGNYKVTTTPRLEWSFVFRPEGGAPAAGAPEGSQWPKEERKPDNKDELCRKPVPLAHYMRKLEEINSLLEQENQPRLTKVELIGLRLYTGPMFEKYNAVLRGGALSKEHSQDQADAMKKRFEKLCLGNRYTTTCHVINSGMVKLGKILKATTVYRGISGGILPDEFWKPNRWNVCGGVEFGFMSTTTNRAVAMEYAAKKAGTIFEIKMGMVDRGADLSWLSQYPHEKEVCFAPLTGLEVLSRRVEKSVLVVDVRLSVNLVAMTIEQVVAKRHKMISGMCEELMVEVRNALSGPEWQGLKYACGDTWEAVAEEVRQRAARELAEVTKGPPEEMNDNEKLKQAVARAVQIKSDFEAPQKKLFVDLAGSLQDMQMPPVCCDCSQSMTWTTYAGAGYENGWVCNNFRKCGARGGASVARWSCVGHTCDYCRECGPQFVEETLCNHAKAKVVQLAKWLDEDGVIEHVAEAFTRSSVKTAAELAEQLRLMAAAASSAKVALPRYLTVETLTAEEVADIRKKFEESQQEDLTWMAVDVLKEVQELYKDAKGNNPSDSLDNLESARLPFNDRVWELRLLVAAAVDKAALPPFLAVLDKGSPDCNRKVELMAEQLRSFRDLDEKGVRKKAKELLLKIPNTRRALEHVKSTGIEKLVPLSRGTRRRQSTLENSDGGLKSAYPTICLSLLLAANREVKKLDLEDIGVKGDGVALVVAEVLKTNNTLEVLEMQGCSVSQEGGAALAEALKLNKTLKRLLLSENEQLGKAGPEFLSALRSNPYSALLELKVDKCNFPEAVEVEIQAILKPHTSSRRSIRFQHRRLSEPDSAEHAASSVPLAAAAPGGVCGGGDGGGRRSRRESAPPEP